MKERFEMEGGRRTKHNTDRGDEEVDYSQMILILSLECNIVLDHCIGLKKTKKYIYSNTC